MEDLLDLRPELKLIKDALLALQEKLLDFERGGRRAIPVVEATDDRYAPKRRLN
jgi:hypothetical protein